MVETRDDMGSAEASTSNDAWWQPYFMESLSSGSSFSPEETLNVKESPNKHEVEGLASYRASQTLWTTGQLSDPIPSGFYCIVAERRFKELFDSIPSLDELYSLNLEGLRVYVILVDDKDKKLSMLKQLTATLVKGLNSNVAAVVKKISGLVCDFYKRPNLDVNPIKIALEEASHALDNQGVQMLGQIKHCTCHARAILFKVLADVAGLDSRLIVGLPREGVMERTDSYRHMSVTVMMNSTELLVDLARFPGRLIPCSGKAIFTSHISAAGESDSADNDSCDSPLEPKSPLCGFSENVDGDGLSHSEPNIGNAFWRPSQKKSLTEKHTASSSPEHPLVHGRSILSGHRGSFREYRKGMTTSRSAGTSPSETRRRRRHSISMVPEIGDDIVRAVRAMNETLKQNRLSGEQVDTLSFGSMSRDIKQLASNGSASNFLPDDHDESSSETSTPYYFHRRQMSSQKATSLPSSPHHLRSHSSRIGEELVGSPEKTSTLNKVIQSSKILDSCLLPFQEWNIDFSELIVGTRVGIGFFGEVFRGIWNGTDVAIKMFLEQDLTIENIEDFCNEISILSRLRHPNVILFLGACTKPPRLSMVTEYMEMGSLYHLIHVSGQKKRLNWRRRLRILCDICRGLMCMHRMKIAHRDLKSANCLVNKHWTVKICDFGLSRQLNSSPMKDSSSAGTPEWMAPELIRNEPFTEKCDIFSLGVIMWELCTLSRPWDGVPSVQVVYAVANDGLRLEIPEGPLGKLIADCWAEPAERPSCEEILSRLLSCEYTLC